jgi:hypothetical protein
MSVLNGYYADQLKSLGNPREGYAPSIKITGSTTATNCMTLNDESVNNIVTWFKDHYDVKPDLQSNTERVFQIVKLGFAKRQYFVNLKDIPHILTTELEKNDAFKIYHFWDTERKACSKKYINEMFKANDIDFKIK